MRNLDQIVLKGYLVGLLEFVIEINPNQLMQIAKHTVLVFPEKQGQIGKFCRGVIGVSLRCCEYARGWA